MLITKIVVNSVGFDRALDSQGRRWGSFINLHEYVELRNETAQPQNLSNWILQDANRHRFVFPVGTIVSPRARLRVHSGEGTNTTTDLYWNRRTPVWNNAGGTVFLYDAAETLIAQQAVPFLAITDTDFPSFQAASSPHGRQVQSTDGAIVFEPVIELTWDVAIAHLDETPPDFPHPDSILMYILRRERRFPGRNRRGVVPVVVEPGDDSLTDGLLVYDSTTFRYDFEETREELEGDRLIRTSYQYRYQPEPRDRILIRSIRQESQVATTGGSPLPISQTVRFLDRDNLEAGNIYYYTAFVGSEEYRIFSRRTQASALATGSHPHTLFTDLPQIHQRLDTVTPPPFAVARLDQSKGQLQRLLEVFDAHADLLHGFIDGLRDLQNPRRVDSRLLPPLAHQIGWRLKDYLNEDEQRTEVRFAPEIYRTVGTLPNIAAIINRLTGWDTKVREFVRNVLVSFDTSRLEQLESGELVYLDGSLQPNLAPPPVLRGRRLPPGSVDTTDALALFNLRTRAFDDQTVYSYDCGQPDGQGDYDQDDNDLYNRETIGIYITPDVDTEFFSPQEEGERIRQILKEFLPIQVRAVFFLQPIDVEEAYDATAEVQEAFGDIGVLLQTELYGEGLDTVSDRIPQWRWFISNSLNHLTIDTTTLPINTRSRTWHTGLDQGL
jgi:phage tail-like protein